MVNVKKKGNAGENAFANWLHSHGVKAYRNGSSGAGLHKGDINNAVDCTFEVKTVKKINLKDAWYQVNRDASIAHNMPVLAIRFDGTPKDEWLITIHSEDFIEMLKRFHGIV
jgi:Holliday junction resolvase